MVIDVHAPLTAFLIEKRKKDAKFTLAPDGVHLNAQGHRRLGETILHAWGVESTIEPDASLLKLMTQRMTLLHDAWLSDVGHKRPGVKPGLPLTEAIEKAKKLEAKIESLISPK